MNKQRKLTISILLVLFTFTGSLFAGNQIPNHKRYWVQSAKEFGKSNKGFWDFPGHLKSFKKGLKLEVWAVNSRNKRDRERQFYFQHLHGDWYTIKTSLFGRHALDVKGGKYRDGTRVILYKKNRGDAQKFKMIYLGAGEWKIYTKRNYVLSLGRKKGSRNGSKVQLSKRSYGSLAKWVLMPVNSKQAYKPKKSSSNNNNKSANALKKALASKHQVSTYFRYCSARDFLLEKASFKSFLNNLSDSNRFSKLGSVLKGAEQNSNSTSRYHIYNEIYQLNLKSSGFTAKMTKAIVKSHVKKILRKESSRTNRGILQKILTKP